MYTDRFLRNRIGAALTSEERELLESSISEVRRLEPKTTLVSAGKSVDVSTLLVSGLMSRYIDDRQGRRQLVAMHVPGEFVDLHAYPLHYLDHSIAALTTATVALVPHFALDQILAGRPAFEKKLWFSTLLDAALHRTWLFRLGRLDAMGRVAHFMCETNARLEAIELSDGHRFSLDLTQTDLAEICGLTIVHTNRVLRQLREAGLCSFRSQTVEIHDRDRLARRGDFQPDYLYLKTSRSDGQQDAQS